LVLKSKIESPTNTRIYLKIKQSELTKRVRVKPKTPSPFGAAKSFKGRLTVLTTEEAAQMAENDENHLLKDFAAPKAIGIQLGYKVPNVAANNFELKPALLNMLSQHMFNDLAHEDPNQHLVMIKELCNTVKINGVEPEAIKLRAFSFSLGEYGLKCLMFFFLGI
jgi:hypothetical protein